MLRRKSFPTRTRRRCRTQQDSPTISTPWEGVQRTAIPEASRPLNLEPRNRTPSKRPPYPSRKTTPSHPTRNTRDPEVRRRTPKKGNHPRVMESLRCKFLLRQEERRETPSGPRLPTNQ